jgi:hypothetical protein
LWPCLLACCFKSTKQAKAKKKKEKKPDLTTINPLVLNVAKPWKEQALQEQVRLRKVHINEMFTSLCMEGKICCAKAEICLPSLF